MMYISEDLLCADVENPANHLNKMFKSILTFETTKDDKGNKREFELMPLLESISMINSFCKIYKLPLVNIAEAHTQNIPTVRTILQEHYKRFLISNSEIHSHFFEANNYEFSNDEFANIEANINALKQDIRNAKILTEEHKERLIEKVNKVQSELGKKMSSLDKTLGSLISIAKALGVAGKESKPAFDRINETINLISKVQDRGDSLPSVENQITFNKTPQVEIIEE